MKQKDRLRYNYEFTRVYRRGRRISGKVLMLHYLKRKDHKLKLGFTVSRKLKGAVKRNRLKRLMRESYRLLEDELDPGYDLIIMGKYQTELPDYFTVNKELRYLLERAGILKNR